MTKISKENAKRLAEAYRLFHAFERGTKEKKLAAKKLLKAQEDAEILLEEIDELDEIAEDG